MIQTFHKSTTCGRRVHCSTERNETVDMNVCYSWKEEEKNSDASYILKKWVDLNINVYNRFVVQK